MSNPEDDSKERIEKLLRPKLKDIFLDDPKIKVQDIQNLQLIEKKLTYLCSPYSHEDQFIRLERFHAVCRCAGILMEKGYFVFSPISHTHPIAIINGLPTGWDFWEKYDRAILECCKEVLVLDIPGWMESKGVLGEIKIARELGIPVRLVAEDGVLLS